MWGAIIFTSPIGVQKQENKMAKLHEILAVEADLEGIAKKVTAEAEKTFKDKAQHFIGFHRTCEMFDDAMKGQAPPDEDLAMVTTVNKKLDYVGKSIAKYYDAVLQKELTNQTAKADLIVEGHTLAKDLPATFLLGLETKLKNLRKMYEVMPTLQPGIGWGVSPDLGTDVYKTATPEIRFKTAKTFQHKILYDATKEHPAQIEKWEETVNVGRFVKEIWCGMLSSADKSQVLGRLDKLIQATKKARQRANNVDVVKSNIGKDLLEYINEGTIVEK